MCLRKSLCVCVSSEVTDGVVREFYINRVLHAFELFHSKQGNNANKIQGVSELKVYDKKKKNESIHFFKDSRIYKNINLMSAVMEGSRLLRIDCRHLIL